MLALVLGFACGGGGDSGPAATPEQQDSGEPAAVDPCTTATDGSGGTVTGVVSCDDEGRCLVPAGSFWMGAADGTRPEACPVREIELSAYRIGRTEVTQLAYQGCVDAGACTAASQGCLNEDVGDDLPMICVDWQQADDFCTWDGGRLPTEAEWERAARGDDGAIWAWGPIPPDCNSANFRYVAAYCAYGVTPVGTYLDTSSYDLPGISAYGLVDTVGNAWEWTADWFDATYYQVSPLVDPPGPTDDCHEAIDRPGGTCQFKAIRGGAYNTTEQTTQGYARASAYATITDNNIGFRCAYAP